ncbi:MAG: TadE/TadG family type IV pilus assembly protein [Hyphomonas sp.]
MKRSKQGFYPNEEGASAVEFALIAPVFTFMMFGMIAFGVWISAAHTVQQAASGAARACVAGLDSNERENLAADYLTHALPRGGLVDPDAVTVAVTDDPDVPGNFRVSVTFDASGLPVWNLLGSTLLPGHEIRRDSVITAGGL